VSWMIGGSVGPDYAQSLNGTKPPELDFPITNAELVQGLSWPSHNSFTLELADDPRQNDKWEVSGGG
jgi:hypothetical protein